MSVFDLGDPASLKDLVWISLELRRGTFFQAPERGSDLHTLRRGNVTPATPGRAEAMAKRALQWLVDAGKAKSITASASIVSTHRLQLNIRVVGANGQPVDLATFVPVGVIPS